MSPDRQTGLARLLQASRYEVLPLPDAVERARALPRGTAVTVTASPRRGIEATLRLAEELVARGLVAVPHLAARLVTGPAELSTIVDRLDAVGVRDVFVVAGDAQKPAGPYAAGVDLLAALAELGHGFDRIGIPGYPAGHPFIAPEDLDEALTAKQPYASYLVTQMCFDAAGIVDWIADLRRRGVGLPVYVGVPGLVDSHRLLRVALKIGVGDSIRFMRQNLSVVSRISTSRESAHDALVHRLAAASEQRDVELAGLHFYTFNEVEGTARRAQHLRNRAAA